MTTAVFLPSALLVFLCASLPPLTNRPNFLCMKQQALLHVDVIGAGFTPSRLCRLWLAEPVSRADALVPFWEVLPTVLLSVFVSYARRGV